MIHPPTTSREPTRGGAAADVWPSMNALVCFQAPREYYRPIIVSTNEIFCGPDCRTVEENGRIRSVQSPSTAWDMRELVAQLPAGQKPDLILVKVDATGRSQPRHLDAF